MSLEAYTTNLRKGDPQLTNRNMHQIWDHHLDDAAVDAYL